MKRITFNYTAPNDCTYIFIGDFGNGEYCRIIGDSISADMENCTIYKATSPEDIFLGDVNGDGKITFVDASLVLKEYV